MSKGTKITSFFEGRRRECFLQAWTHLKTKAGESRIKLELKMPLLNRPLQAMPDAVSEQYAVMCVDSSKVSRANLGIFAEGFTLDFFSTDEIRARSISSTGVMLKKFHLEVEGEGEKRELFLAFVAYAPANVLLRDYCWDTNHGTFFLEAVYSQSEMEFTTLASDDGPDEDDSDPDPEFDGADGPANNTSLLDFTESDPEPTFAKVPDDDEISF